MIPEDVDHFPVQTSKLGFVAWLTQVFCGFNKMCFNEDIVYTIHIQIHSYFSFLSFNRELCQYHLSTDNVSL